jgi:hypothetical protein
MKDGGSLGAAHSGDEGGAEQRARSRNTLRRDVKKIGEIFIP